jgi:hypothetical protein
MKVEASSRTDCHSGVASAAAAAMLSHQTSPRPAERGSLPSAAGGAMVLHVPPHIRDPRDNSCVRVPPVGRRRVPAHTVVRPPQRQSLNHGTTADPTRAPPTARDRYQ